MLQYDIFVKGELYSRQVEEIDTSLISYLVNCGIELDEIRISIKELKI